MPNEKRPFKLITHDNGIYEFYFYESSRRAVDASIEAMDRILVQRPTHNPPPLLILSNNVESGDEPMMYATGAYRKMIQTHGIKRFQNTYFAMVHQPGMLMSFWVTLFSAFRLNIPIRTFDVDAYDEAVVWLLEMAEVST